MSSVTLIIPSYNESQRLPAFLKSLCDLTKSMNDFHIVVSDDGSRAEDVKQVEASIEKLSKVKKELSYSIATANRGKGAAIARIASGATTDVVGFVDADGSVTASECLRLFHEFAKRADLQNNPEPLSALIGSRIKMLGISMNRQWRRHVTGRVFATILSNLFSIPVYDTQCGCKFFRREALIRVMPHAYDERWLWDTQVIILLFLTGATIIECPVSWHETPGSKVSMIKDPIRMFIGLLRFRKYLRRQVERGALVLVKKVNPICSSYRDQDRLQNAS